MRRLRGLVGRLRELLAQDKTQWAIDLALVTAGAAAIKRRLENTRDRLVALEERGLLPLDDFATVGDLDRLRADAGLPPIVRRVVDVDVVEPAPPDTSGAEELATAEEESGGE